VRRWLVEALRDSWDTEEVLQGILRYSTEEILSLRREGVIGGMEG
jgi:hypothetical protein